MRQNVHCWLMACDRKSAAVQRSLGGSISWYSTVAIASRCKFHINATHYFQNARGMKIMSLLTPLMLKPLSEWILSRTTFPGASTRSSDQSSGWMNRAFAHSGSPCRLASSEGGENAVAKPTDRRSSAV